MFLYTNFSFYINLYIPIIRFFIFLDTITLLNQYTNENKRVEIKKALKTAKMILNGIKELNLAKKTMEIERFLELVLLTTFSHRYRVDYSSLIPFATHILLL